MFKIEKGITKPERSRGPGREAIYPWRSMKVGDSFFVPIGETYKGIRGAASSATQRLAPKRFSARKVEGGIRVWRDK